MDKRLGTILGRDVLRVGTNYVFGCGAVKIPVKTVHNFVKELEQRVGKGVTEQEKDYNKVLQIAQERGHEHITNPQVANTIIKFFKKDVNPETPVKKAAKKAAPKKAAKKIAPKKAAPKKK